MAHNRRYKEDEHVVCPFYKRECDIEIKCEGVVSEIISNWFRTKASKEEHKELYCMNNFRRCELCEALENKYGEPC